MNVVNAGFISEDGIDLAAMFGRVFSHPIWVVSSALLFGGTFTVAAFLVPPIYRATTILVPASAATGGSASVNLPGGSLGSLAAAAGLNFGSRDMETAEALAVLRSRQFTEGFIASRHLMPKLFPAQWDSATGQWKRGGDNRPTLAEAYHYFDKKIRTIDEDRKTGLVSLSIDWKNPAEAADWANDMVRLLNQEMRARAAEKADASVRFLNQELQTMSAVEVRTAIARLMESEVKQKMLADVTPDYSFQVVDRAISSDGELPVRPRKVLWAALGALCGLLVGSGCVLVWGVRRD